MSSMARMFGDEVDRRLLGDASALIEPAALGRVASRSRGGASALGQLEPKQVALRISRDRRFEAVERFNRVHQSETFGFAAGAIGSEWLPNADPSEKRGTSNNNKANPALTGGGNNKANPAREGGGDNRGELRTPALTGGVRRCDREPTQDPNHHCDERANRRQRETELSLDRKGDQTGYQNRNQ